MSVPANPKLWHMLVLQAKAKFPTYPSLPASKWVHQEYVKHGGRFVSEATLHQAKHASERMRAAAKKRKGGDGDK
jgi:hypothetical protein